MDQMHRHRALAHRRGDALHRGAPRIASDEDARFVADKMGLAYPILRADKFAERYNAAAASPVFVIDQKGIVRDIEVGYSPTLRQDVAGVISGLLESE